MTYIQPLLLVCITAVIAGMWRSLKPTRLALSGIIGLGVLSLPAADWLFSRPLEAWYPVRPFSPTPGTQAVVVLASGVEPPNFERPYGLPDADTFSRCEHAAWVYSLYGSLPVLACEGAHPGDSVMRRLLRRDGVADDLIWIENRSRSTHENAVFGARILRQHGVNRIVLVVDAQSMPRAKACFEKEGMEVIAAPSAFRGFEGWREILPSWKAVRRNELTLHEMVGLAWYHMRGWL